MQGLLERHICFYNFGEYDYYYNPYNMVIIIIFLCKMKMTLFFIMIMSPDFDNDHNYGENSSQDMGDRGLTTAG